MILHGGYCKVNRSLNFKKATQIFFTLKKLRSLIHRSGFGAKASSMFFNFSLLKKAYCRRYDTRDSLVR